MGICCVDGCDASDSEDIAYFPFPIKPTLRKKWRDAIKSSTKLHMDSRICSRHFSETDYQTVRGKLRLKGRVVPTIGLQKPPQSPPATPPAIKNETEDANSEETVEQNEIENIDDGAEKCTIECVPESILHEESDSDSQSGSELHKEDIEDIIANYHIKQDQSLRDRLKPDSGGVSENDCCKVADPPKDPTPPPKQTQAVTSSPDDVIEVVDDVSKAPVYIEICVDSGIGEVKSPAEHSKDDCLMVLENVEVDIDPATLMLEREEKSEDPISLLTSSDDDDVILQEPKIDTVVVSDETDEDDMPLVKLVKTEKPEKPDKSDKIGRLLWGNLYEYYCFQCKFTTTVYSEFKKHKLTHSKVIQMCEICDFTSASKVQFARHKKKHKDEKRFRCHLCEYRAKHSMSLIYHLKSHEYENDPLPKEKNKYAFRCHTCRFKSNVRQEMLAHVKACVDKRYSCSLCSYKTKRRTDLKRHCLKKHMIESDDDVDYQPDRF